MLGKSERKRISRMGSQNCENHEQWIKSIGERRNKYNSIISYHKKKTTKSINEIQEHKTCIYLLMRFL